MDTFIACFAYGSNKIRIPPLSAALIDLICSLILGLSLTAGVLLKPYLPAGLTSAICFSLLFLLGLIKMLDSITKSFIKKHGVISNNVNFSLLNFRFVLTIYADPQTADIDRSKTISPLESVSLALALSLDGVAVGFGAALGNVSGPAVFLCSLAVNAAAILLGAFAGNRAASKLPFNVSWLSGAILMILAFLKL